MLKNLLSNVKQDPTIKPLFFLRISISKLPLPTDPSGQPVRNIASKRSHAASLAQIAGRVNTAAIEPARGAVEAADVGVGACSFGRVFESIGVRFLEQLRQAVAGIRAVGAGKNHLVNRRRRAGCYCASCGDVGGGGEGGEHGGGLVAGLGAVGAKRKGVSLFLFGAAGVFCVV